MTKIEISSREEKGLQAIPFLRCSNLYSYFFTKHTVNACFYLNSYIKLQMAKQAELENNCKFQRKMSLPYSSFLAVNHKFLLCFLSRLHSITYFFVLFVPLAFLFSPHIISSDTYKRRVNVVGAVCNIGHE